MSRAGVWQGVPLRLVEHVNQLEAVAKELGYDARVGMKTNSKGELVIALILPPKPVVDARESKRLERLKRS
jgi:hypothetical protein